MESLLEQINDNYVCVSPVDDMDDLKNFQDSSATIKEVTEMLLSTMDNAPASADNFAQDLPLVLLEFFKHDVLGKIMYAKGFQTSPEIQDKVSGIIDEMLGPWDGPNVTEVRTFLDS